jgi:SSS family solute:Na+ symporter
MTNDIYGRFVKRDASPKQLLVAARAATLMAGLFMVSITWLIPHLGGAVEAYLTIISILDMPLFVIAIVYGLLWKRANWQGAMAGYAAGAMVGAILRFGLHFDVAPVTLMSGGVALLVCPIVSLMTASAEMHPTDSLSLSAQFDDTVETTVSNKTMAMIGTWILGIGFLVFLGGILMGSQAAANASGVAIGGMLIYLAGGSLRAKAA